MKHDTPTRSRHRLSAARVVLAFFLIAPLTISASAIGAVVLSTLRAAQPPVWFDVDRDGSADRLERDVPSNTVRVVSGATGLTIRTLIGPGGTPNSGGLNGFISIISDLNADGVADVIGVSAGLPDVQAQPGTVWAFDPVNGSALWSRPAPAGTLFNGNARIVPDQDDDGIADILIAENRPIGSGATLVSLRDGAALTRLDGSLDVLGQHTTNGGRLFITSDLDLSGTVDELDMQLFLSAYFDGRLDADVCRDGVLDECDWHRFVQHLFGGITTIASTRSGADLIVGSGSTGGQGSGAGAGGGGSGSGNSGSGGGSGSGSPSLLGVVSGTEVIGQGPSPSPCPDCAEPINNVVQLTGCPDLPLGRERVSLDITYPTPPLGHRVEICWELTGPVQTLESNLINVPAEGRATAFIQTAPELIQTAGRWVYFRALVRMVPIEEPQVPQPIVCYVATCAFSVGDCAPTLTIQSTGASPSLLDSFYQTPQDLAPIAPNASGTIVASGQNNRQPPLPGDNSNGIYTWTVLSGAEHFASYSASGRHFTYRTAPLPDPAPTTDPVILLRVSYRPHFCDAISWTLRITVKPDADNDGIPDEVELGWASDPSGLWACLNHLNPDSDNDSFKDGDEIALGSNPCDEFSRPDARADTDGDGLTDLDEIRLHFTDPSLYDTDRDGASDYAEVDLSARGYAFDPLNPTSHTPGGTVRDGDTAIYRSFDRDRDGAYDPHEEMLGLNPRSPDSDADNLIDGMELAARLNPLLPEPVDSSLGWPVIGVGVDTDDDGLTDDLEQRLGTDSQEWDSDSDGLSDGFEVRNGLNPLLPDSNGNGILDAREDSDSDGLPAEQEQIYGSSNLLADSDYDGMIDAQEIHIGRLPSDPSDAGEFGDSTYVREASVIVERIHRYGMVIVRIGGMTFIGPNSPFTNKQLYRVKLPRGKQFAFSAKYSGDLNRVFVPNGSPSGGVLSNYFGISNSTASTGPVIAIPNPPRDSTYSGTVYTPHAWLVAGNTASISSGRISLLDRRSGAALLPQTLFVPDASSDSDQDGLLDYEDGFNIDPNDPRSHSGNINTFFPYTIGAKAVPNHVYYNDHFILRLKATDPLNDTYPTPWGRVPESGPGPHVTDIQRVWTKPGNVARDPRPLADGGDSVHRAATYAELGLIGSTSSRTFWLEKYSHHDPTATFTRPERFLDSHFPYCGMSVEVVCDNAEIMSVDRDGNGLQPVNPTISADQPRPLVEFEVEATRVTSDSRLVITLAWHLRDQLSELTQSPEYRVDGLRFSANGKVRHTVNGLSQLGLNESTPPFKLSRHDHRDTMEVIVTPPADSDRPGGFGDWRPGPIVLWLESTPNAVGRTGWCEGLIVLAWESGQQPGSLRHRQLGDGSWQSLKVQSVRRTRNSPEGTVSPILLRLNRWNDDDVTPFVGTLNDATVNFEPFAFSPYRQYVVVRNAAGQPRNQPAILCVTGDELPPGLSGIKPNNLRLVGNDPAKLVWKVFDDRGREVTSLTVNVESSGPTALLGTAEDRNQPVTKAQLLTAFLLIADDAAQEMLDVYMNSGDPPNDIVLGDVAFDWNVRTLAGAGINSSLVINIEEDVDSPFQAAELLLEALQDATTHTSRFRLAILDRYADGDRFEQYLAVYRAGFERAKQSATVWATAYFGGITMLTDTAGDVVCTFNDVANGDLKSAAAGVFFTAIPFVSKQNVNVVLKAANNATPILRIGGARTLAFKNAAAVTGTAPADILQRYNIFRPHFDKATRLELARAGLIKHLPKDKDAYLKEAHARMEEAVRLGLKPARQGPGSQYHLHHWAIKESDFPEWFAAHGIDINDPEFLDYVPAAAHRAWHSGKGTGPGGAFNKEWYDFRQMEPRDGYTRENIVQKINDMKNARNRNP